MELKFNIPDYFSIEDWRYFNSLELDNDNEKMIKFLSHISDIEESKILGLKPSDLTSAYVSVLESLNDLQPTFFPIIEINEQLYGYSSISKMTLGEYIDLEKLTKNPVPNLEQIMAILYRPIKKHSFKGITWAFKNTYKIGTGNVENLFKYYTLEEYDSDARIEHAEIMKSLPVAFALGALSFFLALANISLLSTQVSSLPDLSKKEKKEMMNKAIQSSSAPIGDGLLQFITSQKLPSLRLQGTMQSLT